MFYKTSKQHLTCTFIFWGDSIILACFKVIYQNRPHVYKELSVRRSFIPDAFKTLFTLSRRYLKLTLQ